MLTRTTGASRLVLLGLGTALAFLLGAFDIYNTDIGFHLSYGEWILDHRAVPATSVLSERFDDRPWYDDKWLFQAGLALTYRAGGWSGLVALRIALVLALWGALVVAGQGMRRPAAVLGIGGIALLALSERLLLRPELPTYVLLSWFVVFTLRYLERPGRWIWILVPLQIVWVNLHSYFICGPVVLWIAFGGRAGAWWGRERRAGERLLAGARRTLLLVAVAATLASFVNPRPLTGAAFPIYSWLQVFRGGYSVTREFVTEFEPTGRGGSSPTSSQYASAALAAVLAGVLVVRRREATLVDWALAGTFFLFSLAMRRNMALLAAAGGVLAVAVWCRRPAGPRAWIGSMAAALGVLAILPGITSNRLAERDRLPRRFGFGRGDLTPPDEAADFVARHGLVGPYFNDFGIGGDLLWRLGREREPWIDGNIGAYPLDRLLEYHDVMRGKIDVATLRRGHGIEFFVLWIALADTQEILRRLERDPEWALVHLDPIAAVYVRRDGPNAPVARERAIDLAALEAATPIEEVDPPAGPEPLWRWLDPRARPETHLEMRFGQFFQALDGRPKLARRWYVEAVKKGSRDPRLLFHVGQLDLVLARAESARRWLEAALAIEPGYALAWHDLGSALLDLGEIDEAAQAFDRAVEDDPSLAGSTYLTIGRARIFAARGDLDGALVLFDRAARAAADLRTRADVEIQTARALEAAGRHEDARRHLEAAARLAPE